MRVFIIKKKALLWTAAAIIIVLLVLLVWALAGGGTETAPTGGRATVAEYELSVSPGLSRELPVYSVLREDKKIALTVDAAWEDDKTEFILETLKKYNAKATFFLCGVWVDAYPEHVRQIAAAGHEIGNHSLTHPHMNSISARAVQKEIRELDDEIEALTGKRCSLFRAPFGEYNDTVIQAVRSLGYEPIQWNIDTIDWKEERSSQTILDTVLPKLSPGCIILCHNNGYQIKEYLPTLLETAISQGYELVTVSELLLEGETAIDNNGVLQPG